MTDFQKLVAMIECYSEHILDETRVGLNEAEAIAKDDYFDDLIYYAEQFLEFVEAAKTLARAKQVLEHLEEE